ncbi:sigma-70 family RNA polymerase sigma factor [Planctomycetes bacterium K23_9]|uniref:ECF RNA polymerase sigma-E factor n=1 Tax=Stieleria marina TaxID=1930275 RepID=A0A517NQT4_9BACT|nr:ECF RNA polymerase sigma-E factor [Planctomycetes bacterium K23_9]
MVTSSSGSVPDNSNRFYHDNSQLFCDLLSRARSGDLDALGKLLQWYVNYLSILASSQMDRRLRGRMNSSDVVQEAMLAAHRDFGDFRGGSQGELLGWLRQILIHTLHRMFARHFAAEKRDVRRELSLDEFSMGVEESACNLAAILPATCESPSGPMQAREDAVSLANQLECLSAPYRDVIVFRVLQGLSFDEIGLQMQRSSGAVRMLWLRALESFRKQCEVTDEN